MRRSYSGAAKPAVLTAILNGTTAALTIECDDLSNYPTGVSGPFFVVVDRGQVTEEKILCASRTGNTLTVYDTGLVNGRGSDQTTVVPHLIGAELEHIFTATDADEANLHVNSVSNVHGVTGSVVGTTDTQTLTNKTLTDVSIDGATFSGTINGIEVGLNPLFLIGA
jgi:hypothetical protein